MCTVERNVRKGHSLKSSQQYHFFLLYSCDFLSITCLIGGILDSRNLTLSVLDLSLSFGISFFKGVRGCVDSQPSLARPAAASIPSVFICAAGILLACVAYFLSKCCCLTKVLFHVKNERRRSFHVCFSFYLCRQQAQNGQNKEVMRFFSVDDFNPFSVGRWVDRIRIVCRQVSEQNEEP